MMSIDHIIVNDYSDIYKEIYFFLTDVNYNLGWNKLNVICNLC